MGSVIVTDQFWNRATPPVDWRGMTAEDRLVEALAALRVITTRIAVLTDAQFADERIRKAQADLWDCRSPCEDIRRQLGDWE
ncbi:MAG: hypothetical protein JWP74_1529 [Marmoricola sp.]|nr:hypothetical protein [Marmoricola sp.]